MNKLAHIILLCLVSPVFLSDTSDQSAPSGNKSLPNWDKNGYVFFCLCMGRFGNQVEHFLGGAAFAKALNRTLVIPPFMTYRTVSFTDWFKLEPIQKYHRSILAEDFMNHLAPKYWPIGERKGYCWLPPGSKDVCEMKVGFPFKAFWDELGVDFDDYVVYHMVPNVEDDYVRTEWQNRLPPSEHPVLALRGAPASYPIKQRHVQLQKLLVWSDNIESAATEYVNKKLSPGKFVGIHLRNEASWIQGCEFSEGVSSFMESPQCLGYSRYRKVTRDLCDPPRDEVLQTVESVVSMVNARYLFIATDNDPMIEDFKEVLRPLNVTIRFLNPERPQIDLAILGKSDYFIGNCISSFTAFVKRERDLSGLPSAFWAYKE